MKADDPKAAMDDMRDPEVASAMRAEEAAATPSDYMGMKSPSYESIAITWLVNTIVIVAIVALPGGLFAAWYFDNGNYALISVIALIFFMAG